MDINQFIQDCDIQPADAIVVKKGISLLDHYVIYLGIHEYKHVFIANTVGRGVTFISENEAKRHLQTYQPNRINRFTGDAWDRQEALERAFDYPKKAYHLILNNCEHFANFVQNGERSSRQSKIAVGAVLMGLAFIGIRALVKAGKSKEEEELV